MLSTPARTPQFLFHGTVWIVGAVLLSGGFGSPAWVALDGVLKSADSAPFTLAFKPLKLILGLFILLGSRAGWGEPLALLRSPPTEILRTMGVAVLSCAALLIGPALWTGYVRWDPGIPSITPLWILNNLVFVCLGEELFFRGYVQQGLSREMTRRQWPTWIAWVLASVIFGVSHFRGGATLVVLSTFAGLVYGRTYQKAGWGAAVGVHFLVNAVHFFGFSYPRLSAVILPR